MKAEVRGRAFRYEPKVREQDSVRRSFDRLAREVFGISFEAWYQAGFWTDSYEPHVLLDGDEVVACAAANRMGFRCGTQELHYLQIGTVMTHPRYRGQGLGRWLMERVLEQYGSMYDTLYLFANDSAVGFYPKFGFSAVGETLHTCAVAPRAGKKAEVQRLDMGSAADRARLFALAGEPGRFHALSMCGGGGPAMFYGLGPMRSDCYYLPEWDAAAVLQFEGENLYCCDVFGGQGGDLLELLQACAGPQTRRAVLGFTPSQTAGFAAQPLCEDDTTLFMLGAGKALFAHSALRFPELSHA